MNNEKYDLKDRLIDVAGRIIRLLESLPCTKTGNHFYPNAARKIIIEYSALNIESSFLFSLK